MQRKNEPVFSFRHFLQVLKPFIRRASPIVLNQEFFKSPRIMKKSIVFAGFLLFLFTNVISAQCPTGSSSNRFTSLAQARTVTVAGVYYFNISGTTFSTYVDANGYVQVAHDYGNGSGSLSQRTSLNNSTRGILNPTVLSRLTDANEVRISHSGGDFDVTTTNSTILSRLRSNTAFHRGSPDNSINNNWTGTESSAITGNGTCTQNSTNLHENIVFICGNSSGLHWAPSTGNQRIRWSTGSHSGEIPSSESFSLWARASADTSCYTSVPDDAFEAYLEANGMGNGIANDNYVTTANISSVTSLVIAGQNGITNFTGIEDFTSLTSFIISGGTHSFTSVDLTNNSNLQSIFINIPSLTSINVSGLSNITTLNVTGTSVAAVDVSAATSMTYIGLSSTNVSSLDLTNNSALQVIYLNNTSNITTLDVSQNSNLVNLFIQNSNLETVDVRNGNNTNLLFRATNSPNLTCVPVDDVTYSVSNWASYIDDTSVFQAIGCDETYVPDDNFEAFLEANSMGNGVANDNAVTTANISSVTELSLFNTGSVDLTGIEDFAALQSIGVLGTNPITTVDFSSNVNLREIIFFNISTLTSINVSNLSNLETLSLNGNNLSSIDVSDLTSLDELGLNGANFSSIDLSNNLALRDLFLVGSSITSLDVSNNTELRNLDISNTTISNLDISSNLKLTDLDIANLDNITTLDLRAFVNLDNIDISNMDNLQWVDLRNGNNNLLTSEFRATNLPNLTLISVDNRSYSVATWSNIDDSIVFQELNPTTYVPDGDFETYLEDNGMGNGTYNDDTVNTGNIFSVTSLDVSGQLIQDLTGIAGFTALESLTASSNSLSAIDVSNNTALTYLNVHSNASITSIDVSALTSLESLILYGTSITSINVASNTALKTLQLNNTNISSLDVSGNTALENLSIRNISGLTSVDLSANTALDFLDVQNASIPSLDLTSNTSLTQLYAKQGVFSFLDVQNGNNNNVTVFDITQNPSLSCVNVDNAAYSTTNWTSKDAGTSYGEHCYETYVPDNNFEAFLEANGMGNGIANDDYVTTANISGVTTLDVDTESIADMTGIEGFTALTSLSANGNTFTSIDLSANTALTFLDLRNNSIPSVNTSTLTLLETLLISGTNSITSVDVSNNTALRNLQVTSNQVTSLDVSNNTALEALTIRFSGITSLDLSNNTALNYLDIQDVSIATVDLSNNTAFTTLYAARNNALTSLNVKNGNNTNMVTFSIHTNPNLECVVVDDVAYATTNFTNIDAGLLFNTVSCDMTNVPDDNFEAFLEANSMGNGVANDDQVFTHLISGVTTLDMQNQSITNMTGIEAFTALETLFLHSNTGLSSLDVTANTNLRDLRLHNTNISTIDLSNNTALYTLSVLGTPMTSIDVSNNTVLNSIDTRDSGITNLDLTQNTALTFITAQNGSLESLNIKNGNNVNVTTFNITGNSNLHCVQVDNVGYANMIFTNKDAQVTYSETCGTTNVPDDNFEAFLEANNMGNGIANDNLVFTDKIASVTTLDISSQSIANLTGIEGFAALETFSALYNNFSTLDLSANTSLTFVHVGNNTSLTTLNVSALTALEQLQFYDTSVTSIDVTNSPNLTRISADRSSITQLDLSQNTLLTRVQFSDTPSLQTVDLKNGNNNNVTQFEALNTSATCINVDDVAYSSLVWSSFVPGGDDSIFSSHCFETYVPGDNFENYLETHDASGNVVSLGDPTSMGNGVANDDYVTTANIASVTTLNMQTQSIGNLTGIEGFAALTYFEVRGNNLFTSIDLSNNTNLEEAYIGSSPYSTINVSTLTSLRVLDIEDTQLTTLDLSNNTALTTFKLRNSDITNLDLSNNTALVSVDISNSDLTTLNVKNGNNANVTLFDTTGSTNLTCILVDTETYSNTNWTNIASGSVFTDVSCGTTDVPDDNFEAFLETNGMGNGIANDDKVFTHKIASVTTLDVDDQNISDLTGIEDFVALEQLEARRNTTLTSIDVSANTSLTYISLENSSSVAAIDVSALTALEELHVLGTSITSIDVSNNTALRNLRVTNTNITSLDLSANTALENLSAVNISGLTNLDLSANTALTYLNIQNAAVVSLDLSNNTALTRLFANNGAFTSINVKNGNNANLTDFEIQTNPSLNCVLVDDVTYANTNFTNIDAGLIFNNVSCDMTSVPDDNFEAYLEANSMGNGVANDDLVFTHNISSVTTMDLDNQSITDLTGLEDFTALLALNARSNGLTSIDVTANTNLTHLFLDNNSLTSIDLSTITALEEIGLTGNTGITSLAIPSFAALENIEIRNTGITSLNVTQYTELISLDIRETGITSLDLTQNPNLTTFRANNSSLTSLDIRNGRNVDIVTFDTTGATSLTCVNVDDANYSTTNWTNIASGTQFAPDCSYIYMPDDNFEMYLETHNPSGGSVSLGDPNSMGNGVMDNYVVPARMELVSIGLDISGLNISDLTGLEGFKFVLNLDVRDNNITTLDLTGINTVSLLHASNNPITTMDISSSVIQVLDISDTNLTSIDVSNQFILTTINADNVPLATLDVSDLTGLTGLSLANTNLTTLDVSANTSLRNLDLSGSSNLAALNLGPSLNLRNLDISQTSIATLSLAGNLNLDVLNISNTSISSLDLSSNTGLRTFTAQNSALTSLNIKNGTNTNIVGFDTTGSTSLTCIEVDNPMYSSTNWTNVDNGTSFSDVGCGTTSIPDANFETFLESNLLGNGIPNDNLVFTGNISVLTSLDISSQNIADLTGIAAFTSLQTLNAENNNLSTVDLSSNTTLTSLNLAGNLSVTSINVSSLTALQVLNLSNTGISAINANSNTALQTLDIANTSVSNLDISNNTALTTLDIEGTSITSLSLIPHTSLVSFNAKNAQLTSLNIKNGNNSNVTTFDVTGNAGLSCITVDDAGYAVTNWTNIDAGMSFSETTSCATTSISDTNFEAFLEANGMGNGIANDNLVITGNISGVTSLDISNQSIADLTGIEDFTALEILNVGSNPITSVDFTSNTALRELNIRNTDITVLDVSYLTALENLNAEKTDITSIDLSQNTALTTINFSEANNIVLLDLSKNTNLTSVSLSFMTSLDAVDLKNGTNTNITSFAATSTSACFKVDDPAYSDANWTAVVNPGEFFKATCDGIDTQVPDNNFENYLETHDANGNVVSVGDTNSMGNGIANDDYVLTSRISGVTVLNMQNQSITDMTGIEDFTSLQELRLDGNTGLNAIDVNSNTSLTVLRLYQTNVSTLDVSALSNLGDLVIASTQITSIDVSNNTALFALDMRFTNIPTVDLSQNSALTYLNALNASLTSLNVKNGNNTNVTTFELTGNSSLTCVIVDNPGYSYANWTAIESGTSFTNTSDCTSTTSIPDDNLEAYLEANNLGNGIANDDLVYTGNISGLTSLDISNQSIANLTGIEAFTSLITLNVSSNASISSLDVSALTALENLNISNTGITSLDLTSNTALTVFNGQNAELTSLNIKNGTNTSITSFNTTGNSSLSCITVDDAGYSTSNWTNIDGTTAFSGLCGGTYVPDNNFETYLETHDDRGRLVPMGDAESLGNGVMDDYVLTSKIEILTSLFVSNQNISDLTGIEDFTALRSLWVDENSLTSLDVSNNTNLDDLNCSSNSLTSIDVSDLTNLSSLDISNMSNITSIDLSNNTDLLSLRASNTGLTSLDLKAFTSLLTLDVRDAQLTSLDLRNGNNTNMTVQFDGNFDLTCVSVDDVDYANNNWDPFIGEFSLSCGETYVPDDAFEMYLETHDDRGFSVSMGSPSSLGNGSMDNFVTTSKLEFIFNLNLSSESVADLTGIEDFENLSNLDVSFTNITSLDLSGLQFITHLSLSNTSLTSLNVSSYNNLQVLDISDTSISSINLSSNSFLQEINIGNTPMTSIDLSNNTSLRRFEMFNGAVTSLDLSSNTSLTDFNISNSSSLTTVDLRNGNNTNIVGFFSNTNANLTCIQVDDAGYSNTNWTSKDGHTSFGEDGCGVLLSVKMFLHGPYESGSSMMRASLGATHLPTSTPHADGATANSTVFDVTGNDAIVDWVLVELRDKNDITTVLHRASGLLQRDGDIVATDGVSPLTIDAASDAYYISVDHRSHIPIATDATYNLSGTATTIDLTVSANVRGGAGFMHDLGNGKHATFGGDLNGDGQINTADLILGFASIGLPGYLVRDLDLNGQTQTSDMTNVLVKGLGKGKQF